MRTNQETMTALQASSQRMTMRQKAEKCMRYAYAFGKAAAAFAGTTAVAGTVAFAAGEDAAGTVMDSIVDYMKTILKWVGIGIAIFGVYEVAMAFLQQAPEQKTKGILMVVVGGVMIGMGTLVDTMRGLGGSGTE